MAIVYSYENCNPIYVFEGFLKKAQTYLRVSKQQLVCSSLVTLCLHMRAPLGQGWEGLHILPHRQRTGLYILTFRCSVSVLEYFRAFSFFSLKSLRYNNDWHLRLGNEEGHCI